MGKRWVLPAIVAALVAVAGLGAGAGGARSGPQLTPPGAPGTKPDWLPADKHGFGTSRTTASKVWFTLEGGELSEVYFPRLDTPSYRDLQFVVTDGSSFAERERDSSTQRTVMTDPRSLTYEQVNTDRHRRWRLTKTYAADPNRSTVAVKVHFQSLTGRRYHVYVLADPALSNDGAHDTGTCTGASLLTTGKQMAAAVMARPGLGSESCGYKGSSDGWLDLRAHDRLTHGYVSAPDGNVVETAATSLTGTGRHRDLTLALGFGSRAGTARSAARAMLDAGWGSVSRGYAAGWHAYLSSLRQSPPSLVTGTERHEYAVSTMVLAASEDKTFRGAYIASPSMPWEWGTGLQTPTGPYHLVWSRDLYGIATALIADGDTAGARRALHFLLFRQQKPNGSFPQNSDVAGKPVLTNLQLDEVADPIILAEQLGVRDPSTWSHVKRAADFIVGFRDKSGHRAPYSPQERWENQAGYSPATIAAEIAGLVCAADLARTNGDATSAVKYLQTADTWRAHLNGWTLTTNGPYGGAYYLRLTKNGKPNSAAKYDLGDSGPTAIDQRAVVDPSFLELVRLGVESPTDPNILSTLSVVDDKLSFKTGTGTFWHRYTDDGYGELRDGAPWNTEEPKGSRRTLGRLWPILAGERGEYALAAGKSAAPELRAMAATANDGGLLPEQVWDQNPPSGKPGFPSGSPTFSATPLIWTHAQLIRLAWSIRAGAPVEQPSLVACRYARTCAP
jgi:glucoamylase